MNATRKSIATVIVAATLAAPAFTAFAADPAEGYGRAGGINRQTAAAVASTDGERIYGAIMPATETYGRAGRATGSAAVMQSAAWDSDSVEPAATPAVPGRQGAPMTIDSVRG